MPPLQIPVLTQNRLAVLTLVLGGAAVVAWALPLGDWAFVGLGLGMGVLGLAVPGVARTRRKLGTANAACTKCGGTPAVAALAVDFCILCGWKKTSAADSARVAGTR